MLALIDVTHLVSLPMFPQLKLLICTYLVLTIHTAKSERGFRCHDEHSTVKTRERSCLSQERLEQLMHVRMSDVSRSNITEKQLLL